MLLIKFFFVYLFLIKKGESVNIVLILLLIEKRESVNIVVQIKSSPTVQYSINQVHPFVYVCCEERRRKQHGCDLGINTYLSNDFV